MSRFARTQEILDKGRRFNVYPGGILSVGDANGELFRFFCGYRSFFPTPEKLMENTLFDVASLTKIMSTTMVALKFLESGKLRLDDKVSKFFEVPSDKKDITIWNLMTHTSGFPAHIDLWARNDPASVCEHILEQTLMYAPGDGVTYSCLSFILLGKICEHISGKGLDVLARDLVFGPLGMENTGYNPKDRSNIAATEYSFEEKRYIHGEVHDENARYLGGVSGNAGIFSNIKDCVIFAHMLANKGVHEGKEFINRDLFLESIKNHTSTFSEGRGLGFVVKSGLPSSAGSFFPDGSYGHTGFTGTSIWVDIETSQYLALLTNRVHPLRDNEAMLIHRKAVHDASFKDYRGIAEE